MGPFGEHAAVDTTRLRIGMLAPCWFEVPPTGYGGIETLVADLVDGLVAAGHEVTLIGAGRPGTTAQRFVSTFERPPSERLGDATLEVTHAVEGDRVLRSLIGAGQLDLVHDHTVAGPLLARGRDVPTVVTTHNDVVGVGGRLLRGLSPAVGCIAISDWQRRSAPDLPWVGRVHNAVQVASFPFRADKQDYAFFLGRIHPEKGTHLAIDAAREAGVPIVIAGKCLEAIEREYLEREIRPRLGDDVRLLEEVGPDEKRDLLAGARCLVLPVQWDEPFGLVLIEAMACGTPVVALRRGAVPEVVVDGVTGRICDRPDQLAAAIRDVGRIDPAACRRHVARHFDTTTLAERYLEVYQRVLNQDERAA